MKACPSCGEQIQDVAVKCRYCGEIFDETLKAQRRARNGVPLYKRVLLGFLWTVLLYFLLCTVGGGIVGGIAGGKNPDNPVAATTRASQEFVTRWRFAFLAGSVIFSTVGAIFSFLPGTRPKEKG